MTLAHTPPDRHRRPDPDRKDALGEPADGGSGGTLTMGQVAQMSESEIGARMPEVEAAMAASGGRAPTRPPEPETIEDVKALDYRTIVANGWTDLCSAIVAKGTTR
jgi:hypothetical protein